MTLAEILKDSNYKLSQFNLVLKCFQLKLQLEQSLNIDQLVYQLYGLSEEGIKIVEGTSASLGVRELAPLGVRDLTSLDGRKLAKFLGRE